MWSIARVAAGGQISVALHTINDTVSDPIKVYVAVVLQDNASKRDVRSNRFHLTVDIE